MILPFTRTWYLARLAHANPRARLRAVSALATAHDDDRVLSRLLYRLDDENEEVRRAAELALEKLSPGELDGLVLILVRKCDSWRLRRAVVRFAFEHHVGTNESLRIAVANLQRAVEGLPKLTKSADEYVYTHLLPALELTMSGKEFRVLYAEATTKTGPVEMSYEVIDSWHRQYYYGSGNPDWDSIGMTCRYEDGHVETFTYEGTGVPHVYPTTRYKEGIINVLEQFEVVGVGA